MSTSTVRNYAEYLDERGSTLSVGDKTTFEESIGILGFSMGT